MKNGIIMGLGVFFFQKRLNKFMLFKRSSENFNLFGHNLSYRQIDVICSHSEYLHCSKHPSFSNSVSFDSEVSWGETEKPLSESKTKITKSSRENGCQRHLLGNLPIFISLSTRNIVEWRRLLCHNWHNITWTPNKSPKAVLISAFFFNKLNVYLSPANEF